MTPEFVQSFARDCVDAGADLFVGIGPHVLRRIEVYDDSPLFYSLGNFVVQNETVERLPLRSFERYDLDERTHVSAVFDARLYDDGEPKGDLASTAFWGRSCRNVRSRGMAASSGWNSTRVPFNETLPAHSVGSRSVRPAKRQPRSSKTSWTSRSRSEPSSGWRTDPQPSSCREPPTPSRSGRDVKPNGVDAYVVSSSTRRAPRIARPSSNCGATTCALTGTPSTSSTGTVTAGV